MGATLTAPRTGFDGRRVQRPGRVVGVERAAGAGRSRAGSGRPAATGSATSGVSSAGADLGLVAQHAAGQVGGGGGRSSRSSPRARRCRAGSGSAAGSSRAISSVKKDGAGRLAAVDRGRARGRRPARASGVRSQAASSCSVPITLMSWRARGGLARLRVPEDPAVDDGVDARSTAAGGLSSGLRMSASMNSVRSSSASGGRVSIPKTCSTADRARAAAPARSPSGLAMPAISIRRPAATRTGLGRVTLTLSWRVRLTPPQAHFHAVSEARASRPEPVPRKARSRSASRPSTAPIRSLTARRGARFAARRVDARRGRRSPRRATSSRATCARAADDLVEQLLGPLAASRWPTRRSPRASARRRCGGRRRPDLRARSRRSPQGRAARMRTDLTCTAGYPRSHRQLSPPRPPARAPGR